jgi:hypothetical protein
MRELQLVRTGRLQWRDRPTPVLTDAREQVTTLTADWEDAPEAYKAHTIKLVPHRKPLHAVAADR